MMESKIWVGMRIGVHRLLSNTMLRLRGVVTNFANGIIEMEVMWSSDNDTVTVGQITYVSMVQDTVFTD